MKFKIPKKVFIVDEYFNIIQDKTKDGGSFNFSDNTIKIGVKSLDVSPEYIFNVLIHEISEALHCKLNTRYSAVGAENDYKFILDHKEFQNHNAILSGIIIKNIL
jgi:hypothetical protein